jgi:hypothetical protein
MRHDYPKVMGRLSRFFQFVAWLNLIGVILYVVSILTRLKMPPEVRLADVVILCAASFAAHYTLDFLIYLGERIAYIEQIQQQQNKVLSELLRTSKETETLPS